MALLIDKKKNKKLFLILSLIFNIGLLVVFKYTDFLIGTFNDLFSLNLPLKNIALPIGISFYTFQILSYVVDVYTKKVKVQKNILYLGTYIASFPQLIAGPIVRYETVEKELNKRDENIDDFAKGIRIFIKGLGKKVLIANTVGYIASAIFKQTPEVYGLIGSWIGMISYSIQIYFDFSGYSDMAIGMGRMLGFKYLENFNYPYIAKSATDFWRRWHISLSTFFRDYVYIPLGGNKVSKLKWLRNILIVWFLTGLWHGASFNYILWGLYFGIILIVEKLFLQKILDKLPNFVQHLYLILIVIISWTIFRSENLTEMVNILKSMIGLNGIGNFNLYPYANILNLNNVIYFIVGIILCTPILKKIKFKNKYLKDIILIVIFILSILSILTSSYNPFIYFRF